MAIIHIQTLGNAQPPQPAIPSLQEGVPLDFEFYARTKFPGKNPVQKALKAIELAVRSPHTESVATQESVFSENLRTHPCLYADAAAIQQDERVPDQWVSLVNQRRALIHRVLRSVGRIQLYHAMGKLASSPGYEIGMIIGTGFVVAPRVLMTNRHVVELFGRRSAGGGSFRPDGRGGFDPVVRIDFAGVYDEQPELCRITRILYLAPDEGLDVALLHFEPRDGDGPPPLPLQKEEPDGVATERSAFACGYPTSDTEGNLRVSMLFRMLRVKRVSLGALVGEAVYEQHKRVYHTCTTLGGSSGSPIVDFETGTVWAMHFYGNVQGRGNMAEPLWRVLRVPKVKELLADTALAAPPELPPLEQPSSVISSNQGERPVLFAGKDDLAAGHGLPRRWGKRDGKEHRFLRKTIPAVGLISLAVPSEHRSRANERGTGFLVAPDILMTMGGVIQSEEFDPKTGVPKERLVVDFARSGSPEGSLRVEVTTVLYHAYPHLALMKLGKAAKGLLPRPLLLESAGPDGVGPGQRVFVVGHPMQHPQNAPEGFSIVFSPPFGVKRVALGEIMEDPFQEASTLIAGRLVPKESRFFHDCSTAVGDGGAPIVSLETGRVLGIHLGGEYGKRNFAFPTWEALKIPEARAALKGKRSKPTARGT